MGRISTRKEGRSASYRRRVEGRDAKYRHWIGSQTQLPLFVGRAPSSPGWDENTKNKTTTLNRVKLVRACHLTCPDQFCAVLSSKFLEKNLFPLAIKGGTKFTREEKGGGRGKGRFPSPVFCNICIADGKCDISQRFLQ